jgi:hypothetical protein
MLAPIKHILPIAIVQRTRILPVPGEVVTLVGQTVSPNEVIAIGQARRRHILLNVSRFLGVEDYDASSFIERQAGDIVNKGDVIASRSGFSQRVLSAPAAGQIVMISDGRVLIERDGQPFELRAGYPGLVSELIPKRGAIIEITGALAQGVWGNGKMSNGILTTMAAEPDAALEPDQLTEKLQGAVLLAGQCHSAEALKNAADHGVRGLILGSLAPALAALAAKMSYPILVLDGFGQLPMNSVAFRLLSTNDQREVMLNAESQNRTQGGRPEVLIPLPGTAAVDLPPEMGELHSGQRVRITRNPFKGQIATIEAIPEGKITFDNGLRAPGAQLKLENGLPARVPLVNLELL